MALTYSAIGQPHKNLIPLSRRLLRLASIVLLLAVLSLSILSIVAYLSPLRGASRPCLPFSLSKISSSAHRTLSCSAQILDSPLYDAMSGGNGSAEPLGGGVNGTQLSRLGAFLQSQKELFYADVEKGDLTGWTVVMGNEAGDLDSLASSISYAFLASTLLADRTIPLALTPSKYMKLRQENLLAFNYASIDPSLLVYPDTLPSIPALETPGAESIAHLGEIGAEFALVDHNRLLPLLGSGYVNGVIDHHEDEHFHEDAKVRLIQFPTGSCASLVTQYFRPQWEASISGPAGKASGPVPPEVATLLLTAILIDTAGLKSGGKATTVDGTSADFLYPLSNLRVPSDAFLSTQESQEDDFSKAFYELAKAKANVDALNTHELLLRDYKEYTLSTVSHEFPVLRAGLSTVPVGLKDWLQRESGLWKNFMGAVDGYIAEKELDICGILTSFNNDKGKHKREILLVTKSGVSIQTPEQAKRVMDTLIEGFEKSSVLSLKDWGGAAMALLDHKTTVDDEAGGRYGRIWKQINSKATRKQVAPLLKEVVLTVS